MTKAPAAQRKILRDFKFPRPEGVAQAAYYAEARQAICSYHSRENNSATLVKAVDNLRVKASRSYGQTRTRLEQNIRVIESYLKHFPHNKFTILPTPRLEYVHSNVMVSAVPDLYVQKKIARRPSNLNCVRIFPTEER